MKIPPFPWLQASLQNLPFVALDLETTGIDPERAKIVEIAMIPMGLAQKTEFQTLIDPEIPIPKEITRINGITNEMVRGKSKIHEVLPEIRDRLHDSIFVSHNVAFDWWFLDKVYYDNLLGHLTMPHMCTLHLSRKYLGLKSNNLGAVSTHLIIPLKGAHRAHADTTAVREILKHFLLFLAKRNMQTGEDLINARLIHLQPPLKR